MSSKAVFLLSSLSFVQPALAHEGHAAHEPESCLLGLLCGQAAAVGAWFLIGLGLLLWLAGMLPYRAPSETAAGKALSLFRALQARTGKEAAGWRRLFWPLLGLALIGLGAVTLLDWL